MGLPLDDPQFWIVTAAVAAVAGLAAHRLLRSVRAREDAPGCASCPAARALPPAKAGPARPPAGR